MVQASPRPTSLPLVESLKKLPDDWALTPVDGKKAPYQENWQNSPLSKRTVAAEIKAGRCKAVGVLCGEPSGGLLFFDHDGVSCDTLIEKLSGELPKTVGVTSGRPGRYQLIYRMPEQYWGAIATKKLKTGAKDGDGKPEQIEFRWNGCQSVVAGAHPMTGAYRWLPGQAPWECAIAEAPLWMVEQMLRDVPNSSASQQSPTFERWSDEDWALSYLDALHPSRTDDYEDWLAVGMALHSVSDSLLTEWDRWSQQSSKYKSGECQKKWQSFKRSGIAIGSLGAMAKRDGWVSPFGERQQSKPETRKEKPTAGKVIDHPTKQRLMLSKTELDSRITELAKRSQSLKTSEIELDLDDLAKESGRDALTVRKAYEARLKELEAEESADEKSVEIDNLLKLGSYQPTLGEFLHPDLAKPLTKVANLLGTSHAAVLTSLLPIVASLAKVGTSLELIRATNFQALPILYTCLVCESGGMKSPTQKLLLQGLFKLQQRADEQYELAEKMYQVEKRKYHEALNSQGQGGNRPKNGGRKREGLQEQEEFELPEPPEPPKPREYYTVDSTREAIARIQCNQPEQGFLGYFDELVALFKAMGQYSNGRGSDMEDLLSGRDGGPLKINRVGMSGSGVRYFAPQKAYSITGGIQPGVLRRVMGDFSDENGCWARFLFCWMPGKSNRYPKSDGSYDIDELTVGLYSRITEYEPQKCLLSKDALELYVAWHDQLADLCEAEPKPALKAVLSKMKKDTGVIALLLHLTNAAAAREQQPASEVSVETMRSAIKLAKYYIEQSKLLHVDGGAANGDEEAIIVKLVQLSDKRPESSEGWIDAQLAKNYLNFFKRYKNGKPAKAVDIQKWFQRAVELGYGELSPNEKKWRSKKWSDSATKGSSNSSTDLEEIEMVQDFERSQPEPISAVIIEYEIDEELEDHGGEVPEPDIKPKEPSPASNIKGSTVVYCGNDQSLARICGQKRLKVVGDTSMEFGVKTVEVRAEGWSVTRRVPLGDVRLTRGIEAVST
jgi:hypothetical protein